MQAQLKPSFHVVSECAQDWIRLGLHVLRRKRLAELATALWGERAQPTELTPLLGPIADLERRLDGAGQELALLEARVADADRVARESEAAARLALINANLNITVFNDRLPATVNLPSDLFGLEHTGPMTDDEAAITSKRQRSPRPDPDALQRLDRSLREAEHRLATLVRRRRREEGELEGQVAAKVLEIRALESEVGPRYEQLSSVVQSHALRRPALRPLVVAFAQLDGAIAAYQALLAMMDSGA